MSTRNLSKIFEPQRVAVIGAGGDANGVGAIVLRNLIESGFPGVVFPVNPHREAVHGIQAYPDVAALPSVPDLAVLCTPAPTVAGLVGACGEAGIPGVLVLSAGFRETGPAGAELERELAAQAARFPGTRILGPNCLGVIAPRARLNASFAGPMPREGQIAFVSQSGALCTSVLDWANERGIGFSHFISVGNMLDVDLGDLIDYLGRDSQTRAIILYVESITEPRTFMSAARAFTRSNPIVAYKAGRFAASAAAAASHTGALAGEDAVYDAAFQRAGIERVADMEDIFDIAELLSRGRRPRGARLAIVSNAGGPGVMALDTLLERGGALATLEDGTVERLDGQLPAAWSRANPVDVLGDAPPQRFADAAAAVLADPGVDAALAILTPQAMTDPAGCADAVLAAAAPSPKPLLAAWMGGAAVRSARESLAAAGIPAYTTPGHAVRAFMHLVSYARNLEILYETPRAIPAGLEIDRARAADLLAAAPADGDLLSEAASKALLEAYGMRVALPQAAATPDEAVEHARATGYPVVLKVHSPDITHKTDVGGVVTSVRGDGAVRDAFAAIVASVAAARPDARIDGVLVEPMVTDPGIELILGARKDPTFGAVMVVGMGGVTAELIGDRALGLPPLTERLARRMLESLRSWPLLVGYRGRPGVDLDRLIEAMLRVSYLVADCPQIAELDINPLLATPAGSTALDARVILDRGAAGAPARPYGHLAIRPYPEELVRPAQLADGTPIVLRPIRPEDEPLWHELLARCSPESLHSRFREIIKETTHRMATRYCYVDYDREHAMVAEIDEGGAPALIGVARLVSSADAEWAEYAVLVGDPWQGRGLAEILTTACLDVARAAGLRRVVAETTDDNRGMLAILRHHGFTITRHDRGEVEGTLDLAAWPTPG